MQNAVNTITKKEGNTVTTTPNNDWETRGDNTIEAHNRKSTYNSFTLTSKWSGNDTKNTQQ
jgi:hypothetical protein